MRRRAIIIYCDDSPSGSLTGPYYDNSNYRDFLASELGGNWYDDEIVSLRNPTRQEVRIQVAWSSLLADYAFTIFSGHGYISVGYDNVRTQYLELSNGDLALNELVSAAGKQTIIVDSCRGYIKRTLQTISKSLEVEHFETAPSTRPIFDRAVERCSPGTVFMYAASENQSALDTTTGGAYLKSLLLTSLRWESNNTDNNILPLNIVHSRTIRYLSDNFETNQVPAIFPQNRNKYFPFAVKYTYE